MGSRRHIPELDGLRAIAILWVVSYHYLMGWARGWWFAPITQWGWAGVDLFFVVSGYLITNILLSLRSQESYFRTFYARRSLRIFPPYFLVLGLCALASIASGLRQWRPWAAEAFYLAAWFPDRLVRGAASFSAPWVAGSVAVFWSLSVEEWFYVVWAPVVRWLSRTALWRCVIGVLLLAPILRALLPDQKMVYFFAPARADALAFGALLALFATGDRAPVISGRALGAALAATAAALLTWGALVRGYVYQTVAFSLAGYTVLDLALAALVWYCLCRTGTGGSAVRILRTRPMRYVGKVSYMLYLIHRPVLALVAMFAAAQPVAALLALALSIALAGASWRYFERPILAFKDRRYTVSSQRSAAVTSV